MPPSPSGAHYRKGGVRSGVLTAEDGARFEHGAAEALDAHFQRAAWCCVRRGRADRLTAPAGGGLRASGPRRRAEAAADFCPGLVPHKVTTTAEERRQRVGSMGSRVRLLILNGEHVRSPRWRVHLHAVAQVALGSRLTPCLTQRHCAVKLLFHPSFLHAFLQMRPRLLPHLKSQLPTHCIPPLHLKTRRTFSSANSCGTARHPPS